MRRIVSAAFALWLTAGAMVEAEPVVIVELYTSQGCSSCPPTDEFVSVLASHSGVLPLALHVDYWDYIGWADVFAQTKFSDRQRAYAKAAGSTTVYTPQVIIGGQDRIEGFEADETLARVHDHLDLVPPVTLEVTRDGDLLSIKAKADLPPSEPVRVQLVRYKPEETVTIDRGENAGRTITYRNIVVSWERLEDWSGLAPLELTAPFAGDLPGVVILQNDGPAAILAATSIE